MPNTPGWKERERRAAEHREKALAFFPYERVEVHDEEALAVWEKLKTASPQ